MDREYAIWLLAYGVMVFCAWDLPFLNFLGVIGMAIVMRINSTR
jgi:hypothetical protein